ncbi:hypothetical protein [Azospirillum sp. ST 5-10]|uniref:hypothetical protein n=1 Tax=unclassified Azospirillum TaxID=2630922 RepID=UPI003F49C170
MTDEMDARKLALEWIGQTRRAPADVYAELLRLYGHPERRCARPRQPRRIWSDVYDLMWPMIMESPTYAQRVARAVKAARLRGDAVDGHDRRGRVVA